MFVLDHYDREGPAACSGRRCAEGVGLDEQAATSADDLGVLRIGELSRRVGLSDHVLRAWERRYGLLEPVRTSSGYRLYSARDERRVRRMQALLAQGLSAAEAARAARDDVVVELDAPPPAGGNGAATASATVDVGDLRRDLARTLEAMDEPAAQRVLDTLLAHLTVESAVRDVVMPYLHDLGDRWASGEVGVAQEHFASQVLRGRLASLARGWGQGPGPRALLACPPGERHDLALLAFGIVLGRRGWAVSFLGGDTPLVSVADAVEQARPDLVVLAATDPALFAEVRDGLADLAARVPLHLAGRGADAALAAAVGARLLDGDPVSAAEALAG